MTPPAMPQSPQPKPSMLKAIFSRRMLVCVFCGFASGMPLYVLVQLLPAWLRDQGVSLKSIALFSLVGFPYTWKFLWSPFMDRIVPPILGRRRGWAAFTQLGLAIALASFSLLDPKHDLQTIAVVVTIVAFLSASQDIVLDAHRRELLPDSELGLGNSFFVNAYRASSLVPGSLALILADLLPWSQVHLIVASFMLLGVATSLWMPEPAVNVPPPRDFKQAVIDPFHEFFSRNGVKSAMLILTFMLLYKVGDSMATALATPFYLDLGFTKTEIGSVAKVASLWASIGGGIAGGLLMLRIGINRALWLFGVVQVMSILGFAALAEIGHSIPWLFAVVSFEYLGVGLGTAAFVAFIARSADKRYTATQIALLTSLTGVPRTFANASTGWIIEQLGYTQFFLLCTVIALPGMVLLHWVAPWGADPEPQPEPAT
ncbi:MAG: AmpG family muropeptide MFS transporter [Myxococcales bacterium]|nr:AmpG family muropeptide MFS transporter [Myxococcales bacterium]